MRLCRAGMIGTSNCKMIWAVMYGYTPIANREKFCIVPPDSRFRKPRKPVSPCAAKKAAKASRLIPGTGTFAAMRKRISIPSVISIFFLMSCERHRKRHADCFFSGISGYSSWIRLADQLNAAAGCLDLCLGSRANAMSTHFEGNLHFAASQNDNRVARVAQQTSFQERVGVDLRIRFEGFGQLIQINFVVFHLIARCKTLTAHKWQAAVERQVAALAVHFSALTRARSLTFGTAAGSLALPRGDATPHAL